MLNNKPVFRKLQLLYSLILHLRFFLVYPLLASHRVAGHRSRQKSVRFREITLSEIESQLEAYRVQ